MGAQGCNQLLSHFFNLLTIEDHWKRDDEFIPAQTRSDVALAKGSFQAHRDGLQHAVSYVVTERIVDVLEKVQVEQ